MKPTLTRLIPALTFPVAFSVLLSACTATSTATSNTAQNHATIFDRAFDDDVVFVNPDYPAKAAQQGIEGFVKLSFDVNELGKPQNIKVLQSYPTGIFDQHAVKALSNWQYKTKMVNGVAVKNTGLSVQLDFDMT